MNKFMKKMKNKKGFTLIELIVVIAILGILAAIAIPRLGGFRDNAEDQANVATARTILSAASIAEADKGAAFDEAAVESHLDLDITLATTAPTATAGWVLVVPADGSDMSVYLDNTQIDVTP